MLFRSLKDVVEERFLAQRRPSKQMVYLIGWGYSALLNTGLAYRGLTKLCHSYLGPRLRGVHIVELSSLICFWCGVSIFPTVGQAILIQFAALILTTELGAFG